MTDVFVTIIADDSERSAAQPGAVTVTSEGWATVGIPTPDPSSDAWLHLIRIAADAGKHLRTSSHLKPDEAALLVAEVSRLRSLVGEAEAEIPPVRDARAARFARAA